MPQSSVELLTSIAEEEGGGVLLLKNRDHGELIHHPAATTSCTVVLDAIPVQDACLEIFGDRRDDGAIPPQEVIAKLIKVPTENNIQIRFVIPLGFIDNNLKKRNDCQRILDTVLSFLVDTEGSWMERIVSLEFDFKRSLTNGSGNTLLTDLTNFVRNLPNLYEISFLNCCHSDDRIQLLRAASGTTLTDVEWAVTHKYAADYYYGHMKSADPYLKAANKSAAKKYIKIANVLKSKKQLVRLVLDWMYEPIPESASKILMPLLGHLSNLPTFKILELKKPSTSLKTLYPCRFPLSKLCKNRLVSLNLNIMGTPTTTNTTELFAAIRNSTSLKHLRLSGVHPKKYGNKIREIIRKNNKKLKHLKLDILADSDDEGKDLVDKILMDELPRNTSITHIDFGSTIALNTWENKLLSLLGAPPTTNIKEDQENNDDEIHRHRHNRKRRKRRNDNQKINRTIVCFGTSSAMEQLKQENPKLFRQVQFLLCLNRLGRQKWHEYNNNNATTTPDDDIAMTCSDTVQKIQVLEELIPDNDNIILDNKTTYSSDAFKISLIFHMLESIPSVMTRLVAPPVVNPPPETTDKEDGDASEEGNNTLAATTTTLSSNTVSSGITGTSGGRNDNTSTATN